MELCSYGLSTAPKYQIFGLLYDVFYLLYIYTKDKSSKNSHTLFTTACNLAGIESRHLKRQSENNILFITVSLTYSKKNFGTNLSKIQNARATDPLRNHTRLIIKNTGKSDGFVCAVGTSQEWFPWFPGSATWRPSQINWYAGFSTRWKRFKGGNLGNKKENFLSFSLLFVWMPFCSIQRVHCKKR